jgi:hypothetical protein
MWCQWEGCNERYGEQHNNDAVKEHYRAHVRAESVPTGHQPNRSPRCQWPGCQCIFVQVPTDEDWAEHMRSHGLVRDGPDAPAGPLRLLGLGTEGLGTLGLGLPGNSTAATEIDDNKIPQQLKDAYPGMNFYCPVCLMLVSGKNASPCKVSQHSPPLFEEIMTEIRFASATAGATAMSKATQTGSS